MKLRLFKLLFGILLLVFVACENKEDPDPNPENPEEIVYPDAPEVNTVLTFKKAITIDSIGIEKFFDSKGRLFALSYHNGVLISDDQGQNWSTSNTGIDAFGYENGPKMYIERAILTRAKMSFMCLQIGVFINRQTMVQVGIQPILNAMLQLLGLAI